METEAKKEKRASVVMNDGSSKVRNSLMVYIVACFKLIADAILVFCYYDKLKSWNLFGDIFNKYVRFTVASVKYIHIKMTFQEFWVFFALVFCVLYILMMTQIQVRNKGTYLLFSFFYIFDVVFLMQPTSSLALFAILIFFLHILRQKTLWRYAVAAVVLAGYAWLFNKLLLTLIPVFLIVFLWRKSDRWGLRLLMLCVIAFCLAYQLSMLTFLHEARPDSEAATCIHDIFSEENILPHVSYYLMNLGYIFLKLLFPFDVIGKCGTYAYVLPFLHLLAVLVFLRAMVRQVAADWKHGIRKRDVMTQDVMVFLFSFILLQAFYEPDYLTAMKHIIALVPFYFYLLFESDARPYKMRAEREFEGTCPVIVCHLGNEDYVYDSLQQAGKICGGEKVVLLGDESNRGFCSNHYLIDDYLGDEVTHFREIYKHLSTTKSYDFELRCFERHFALYDFCEKHGIAECYFCDSDVLVFDDITGYDMKGTDFACCCMETDVTLGEIASPHILYWKVDRLRQFLDFVLHTYSSEVKWLEEVSRRENATSSNPKGDISDMILLTAWRKISCQYDSTFHFRNLAHTEDGVVFDLSLTTADNAFPNEYVYSNSRKIKDVHFKKLVPYLTPAADKTNTEETFTSEESSTTEVTDSVEVTGSTEGTPFKSQEVKAAILHCHTRREAYSVLLCKGVNLKPRYWIRRLVNYIL